MRVGDFLNEMMARKAGQKVSDGEKTSFDGVIGNGSRIIEVVMNLDLVLVEPYYLYYSRSLISSGEIRTSLGFPVIKAGKEAVQNTFSSMSSAYVTFTQLGSYRNIEA